MTEKTAEFCRSVEKGLSPKYTLNACKLELEVNIFDFYVEPVAFKILIR